MAIISRRGFIGGVGALSMMHYLSGNNAYSNSESEQITEALNRAVVLTTLHSLNIVAIHGGYYKDIPKPTIRIQDTDIPVYYDKGTIRTPTIRTIERELTDCIEDKFFGVIREDGKLSLDYDESRAKFDARLRRDKVVLSMNLKLISSNGRKISLDPEGFKVPTVFSDMIDFGEYYLSILKSGNRVFNITEINSEAKKRKMKLEALTYKDYEGATLVRITPHEKGESYINLHGMSIREGDSRDIDDSEDPSKMFPKVFNYFEISEKKNDNTPPTPRPPAPKPQTQKKA